MIRETARPRPATGGDELRTSFAFALPKTNGRCSNWFPKCACPGAGPASGPRFGTTVRTRRRFPSRHDPAIAGTVSDPYQTGVTVRPHHQQKGVMDAACLFRRPVPPGTTEPL